jgi:hypothetical protein
MEKGWRIIRYLNEDELPLEAHGKTEGQPESQKGRQQVDRQTDRQTERKID